MWPDELVQRLSREVFGRYDSNANGVLSHHEYEQYCKDIYFCLELSMDEWREVRSPRPPRAHMRRGPGPLAAGIARGRLTRGWWCEKQCDGLGVRPSHGVGVDDFVKLYTDFGR